MVVKIRRLWNTGLDSTSFPTLPTTLQAREQWGWASILFLNLLCPDTSTQDADKSMPVVTLHH